MFCMVSFEAAMVIFFFFKKKKHTEFLRRQICFFLELSVTWCFGILVIEIGFPMSVTLCKIKIFASLKIWTAAHIKWPVCYWT